MRYFIYIVLLTSVCYCQLPVFMTSQEIIENYPIVSKVENAENYIKILMTEIDYENGQWVLEEIENELFFRKEHIIGVKFGKYRVEIYFSDSEKIDIGYLDKDFISECGRSDDPVCLEIIEDATGFIIAPEVILEILN